MRKGRSRSSSRRLKSSTCSSTVGPSYQGASSARATMLAPSRALIGMKLVGCTPRRPRKSAYSSRDRLEGRLVPVEQVHLVDQHGDLADAEHREDVAVALGVLAHALVRVDHEQRRLGARGAGDHVLEELDVAGRVVDDVVPLGRLEEAARRVDGDALRLLVLERVEQERVLEGPRVLRAHRLDLIELALGQRAGVGHEPADDRALAVVDVADDDDVHALEVERRRGGVGRRRGAVRRLRGRGLRRDRVGLRRAHMYPSRRSVSRPPPSSLSWARPLRSAMLLNLPLRSSSMISATFVAADSHRRRAGPAAQRAVAHALAVVEVERGDGDVLALDVLPDVELGPVEQRVHAHVRAGREVGLEVAPQLGRLVVDVPVVLDVARREVALLGARALLVGAHADDHAGVRRRGRRPRRACPGRGPCAAAATRPTACA